jgi:STE24 endopeptidase
MKFDVVSCFFVTIYLLQLMFAIWMERLNRRHRLATGNEVPSAFQGYIDAEQLARINAYSAENSRLFVARKAFSDLLLLFLMVSGLLSVADFVRVTSDATFVLAGLSFFVVLGLVFFALELPFDYYHTFVIEEKYGFNRSDFKTWILDVLKSGSLSLFFLIILLGPLLWTIRVFPHTWWFWGFVAISIVQLLAVALYPVLIAPLFNKFEPLADAELAERVRRLAEQVGMKTSGIFQMDAGRRSTHSNAYFTGLGKTKRIVLFDTLLQAHTHEEILGVLAHEMGHFRLKHVLKSYLLSEAGLFVGLYLTYLLVNWDALYTTFGFDPAHSYLGLFVVGIFWQKAGFFLRPPFSALSRRFERQADAFAVDLLKRPEALAAALKKMAGHNLSNLTPHPFYVWFYYSHPPMIERVTRLEQSS